MRQYRYHFHFLFRSHRQFLLRPDLGRRLDAPSLARLNERARKGIDIQPVLADGLSAVACMGSGLALLAHFTRECEARGWSVGTPMCARYARVWLEDEIGETVNAKVAAILLGARPGLGTGDGLSAYLVYTPKLGCSDGDRNMMSNIHARGAPPEQAARRLAVLAGAMLDQRTSGVPLNLAGLDLGDAGGGGYRAPDPRVRLVYSGAQLAADFDPVAAGQHQVEDDQIEAAFIEALKRLRAVQSRGHVVPLLAQRIAEQSLD